MIAWLMRAAAAAQAAAEPAPVAPADEGLDLIARLGIATGLLAIALILLVLEFFVVSGGVIGALAVCAGIAAIFYAFTVGPAAGWAFMVATPILGILVLNWGLRRLQRSKLVVQATVSGDAGYRHRLHELGIDLGARGVLVTDAFPTGRARFPGGDIDVSVRGATAGKGAAVEIIAIEGPTVFVSAR
ncbi:MAG TPA: NfeD family protein [Planctomycetota bacterium]|nr:NfeD family protein [Planctomycetota bacterium]